MVRRYGLRDDQWEKIKDFLPGRKGHVGRNARDNRLFVEVVIWKFRSGAVAVIPPKANRKTQRPCDYALYRDRRLIENFFQKLKQFRDIATRYDKRATHFLSGIYLAASVILLN